MRILQQGFYDEFTCLCGDCPTSCCQGWQIVIDEDTFEKYDEIAQNDIRLRSGLDYLERSFLNTNANRCSMLDEDGLCYLQRVYGEEIQCNTCYSYPRHLEEFEGTNEYSLSLSCPEAARMTLEAEDSLDIIMWEEEEEDAEAFEDFDEILYKRLFAARDIMFEIATNKKIGIRNRFDIILAYAREFQEYYDNNDYESIDALLLKTDSEIIADNENFRKNKREDVVGEVDSSFKNEFDMIKVLIDLEQINDDWNELLQKMMKVVFWEKEYYMDVCLQIEKNEEYAERLLISLLFTYFCGAVYDDMILSKAAFAVQSVKWIFYIAYSSYRKEEAVDFDAILKATVAYAREVEHSPENLNMLDDFFQNLPA